MEPEVKIVRTDDANAAVSTPAIHQLDVRNCPIDNIVVYTSNQAEITRRIKATLSKGTNEIHISNMVSKIDDDSVRVNAGSGKGVVILEVTVSRQTKRIGAVTSDLYNTLTTEINEMTEKRARLREEVARIQKEQTWIQSFATQFLGGPCQSSHSASPSQDFSNMINASNLNQIGNFLDFYQQRLSSIDERMSKANKEIEEIGKKIDAADAKRLGTGATSETSAEALVLVESPADNTEVVLQIAYLVQGATWAACYDCRVDSSNKTLQLTYHGKITNSTGEDWVSPLLLLSTAQPSIGGAPPTLTTKFVNLRSAHYQPMQLSRNRASGSASSMSNALFQQAELSAPFSDGVSSRSESASIGVLTAESKDSGTCATFSIKRQTTICSDSKPHKVVITVVTLDARFTYSCVPQLSPHAYLKASVMNTTSTAPFLAGEMNVFMDGNFVAKSSIKATHPGESFAMFLGIDDAVKVDSEPLVALNNTAGWVSKSNVRDCRHRTFIKNTKPFPIDLTVFEQLPKSTDGRLKVKLTSPVISEQTPTIKLTDANNIKWKFASVDPGQRVETVIEYRYEWPLDHLINE